MSISNVMVPKHFADLHSSILHELPAIALRIVLRVLVIVMLVPVLLLYAGTAVPWIFMLILLLLDGVLLWRLIRHTNTSGRDFLLMLAIGYLATLAVMLS